MESQSITSSAILVEGLTKRFGDFTAVDNVSFEVPRGEVFGLLGPNGAGKTTVVRMLTTLLTTSGGKAYVTGHDVARYPRRVRESIGVIPQAMTSDLDLTGWENIDIYGEFYGVPRRERHDRAQRLLKLVGLSERQHDLVATYSGGMRRRLEIARGLIHSPKVLFLDEPTIGLDPQSRRAVHDLLEQLRTESELTISLTTHYMDEAESLCDRIAIVDSGKIIALDTPAGLKARVAGSDRIELKVAGDAEQAAGMLRAQGYARQVEVAPGGQLSLSADNGAQAIPRYSTRSRRSAARSTRSASIASRSRTSSSISPDARCATKAPRRSACSSAPGCRSTGSTMKAWAVMRRDLLKQKRNPMTLITSVLMPIVYLVIMGNAFHGVLTNLSLAVVSQDNGPYGRRVVEQLQALAAGPKTLDLWYMNDPASAIQAVRDGRYKGALVIPPDFSHRVAEGRIAEIGLFTDNIDSISSDTLGGALEAATEVIRMNFVTAREPKLNQIVLRPTELFTTVDYDRSLIPGVIVMALFMGSLMAGVFNWVMDKFLGVTECYLVTPLSRWQIAGGMLASGVVVVSFAATIVLFTGLMITGGTIEGGLPALAMLLFLIVIGGTGLLAMTFAILGRASHPRLVGMFSGFLNVILFFPSGAIYPVESFPHWLRVFARYNPETHLVSALKSILFKGV